MPEPAWPNIRTARERKVWLVWQPEGTFKQRIHSELIDTVGSMCSQRLRPCRHAGHAAASNANYGIIAQQTQRGGKRSSTSRCKASILWINFDADHHHRFRLTKVKVNFTLEKLQEYACDGTVSEKKGSLVFRQVKIRTNAFWSSAWRGWEEDDYWGAIPPSRVVWSIRCMG